MREEGSSLTRGITTSGVKPPDFSSLFWLPPLSPSTLALPARVSFLSRSLLWSSWERRKGREEKREVGSLGERSNWLQPAHSRILFTGSSPSSPAAHPQPPHIAPGTVLSEKGIRSSIPGRHGILGQDPGCVRTSVCVCVCVCACTPMHVSTCFFSLC